LASEIVGFKLFLDELAGSELIDSWWIVGTKFILRPFDMIADVVWLGLVVDDWWLNTGDEDRVEEGLMRGEFKLCARSW